MMVDFDKEIKVFTVILEADDDRNCLKCGAIVSDDAWFCRQEARLIHKECHKKDHTHKFIIEGNMKIHSDSPVLIKEYFDANIEVN